MSCELDELLRFAKRYSSLGNSVQEQFQRILEGYFSDINPNAVSLMHDRLSGINDDLDVLLVAALDQFSHA